MTDSTTEYPHKSGDFTIIGPECFAGNEDTVISWQGENFYRACGHQVTVIASEDFGQSDGVAGTTCVKRVGHPGVRHEDYDGNTYDEVHGAAKDKIEIDLPVVGIDEDGLIFVTKLDIRAAYDAFVKPTQDAKEEMSKETRTVAAVLRSVNQAMPTVSALEGDAG